MLGESISDEVQIYLRMSEIRTWHMIEGLLELSIEIPQNYAQVFWRCMQYDE